jgi:micrococcal nuclease
MSRNGRRAVLFALPLMLGVALASCAAHGEAERASATIERVIDGDTVVLEGGERVRLLQIDAPEASEECYAAAAARELNRLSPRGTPVVLETDPVLDRRDRYGRLLRYEHVGRTNVNVELVRRGAATPYFYRGERGRYAGRLLAAIADARSHRRGMWGACRVLWRPDRSVTTRSR